jgi:hypothetical protein
MQIISPLFVMLPRVRTKDKKVLLNLNVYRNLHYISNNQAKEVYKNIMFPQLKGKKFDTPIDLQFELFKARNAKIDRSNVLSVVEKFFCDALVACGCIPDDNDEYIRSSYYRTAGVDKENPRVEIWIK